MLNALHYYRLTVKTGFTLVELLIALFLGALLITMLVSLYVSALSTGTKTLMYTRLRCDLHSIVTLIEADIRRAGYGGNDYRVGIDGDKNVDINSAQDCIVYYYNHNDSATIENSNKMAFRFEKGAIRFKSGVEQVAESACAAVGGWSDISDVQFITITGFTVTEQIISTTPSTLSTINIEISAQLAADEHYTYSITSQVQVHNDSAN